MDERDRRPRAERGEARKNSQGQMVKLKEMAKQRKKKGKPRYMMASIDLGDTKEVKLLKNKAYTINFLATNKMDPNKLNVDREKEGILNLFDMLEKYKQEEELEREYEDLQREEEQQKMMEEEEEMERERMMAEQEEQERLDQERQEQDREEEERLEREREEEQKFAEEEQRRQEFREKLRQEEAEDEDEEEEEEEEEIGDERLSDGRRPERKRRTRETSSMDGSVRRERSGSAESVHKPRTKKKKQLKPRYKRRKRRSSAGISLSQYSSYSSYDMSSDLYSDHMISSIQSFETAESYRRGKKKKPVRSGTFPRGSSRKGESKGPHYTYIVFAGKKKRIPELLRRALLIINRDLKVKKVSRQFIKILKDEIEIKHYRNPKYHGKTFKQMKDEEDPNVKAKMILYLAWTRWKGVPKKKKKPRPKSNKPVKLIYDVNKFDKIIHAEVKKYLNLKHLKKKESELFVPITSGGLPFRRVSATKYFVPIPLAKKKRQRQQRKFDETQKRRLETMSYIDFNELSKHPSGLAFSDFCIKYKHLNMSQKCVCCEEAKASVHDLDFNLRCRDLRQCVEQTEEPNLHPTGLSFTQYKNII